MKGTQIDMKKKRFATIVAALLVISLASCSTPAGSLPSAPDGSHVPEKTQALYSNLTDDSSRREVVDALQAHGVSQEQTDTLLAWADDFNARVTTPRRHIFYGGQLPPDRVPVDAGSAPDLWDCG